MRNYYLDESGNTGDLSAVKSESYFRDQRIFALAAVGCEVDGAFIESIEALKKSHRIGGSELKSRQVYDRPRFVLELVEMLKGRGCPIFVEAVDKHYFVIMQIIERVVVPYVGDCDITPEALQMKAWMADYMALYAPPALAHAYVACCQNPDYKQSRDFYKSVIRWAESCRVSPFEIAEAFVKFTRESLKDFRKLPKAEAINLALPVPDPNPAGRLLWILPNLSSFTHIYARINRFCGKDLNSVTIHHDEQLQFGDILQQNKLRAEELVEFGRKLPLETADFEFLQSADLKFVSSQDSTGVQVADVLAGFVARYVQDAVWGGVSMHPDKVNVFRALLETSDRQSGMGVNFVAPESLVRLLGVVPEQNFSVPDFQGRLRN